MQAHSHLVNHIGRIAKLLDGRSERKIPPWVLRPRGGRRDLGGPVRSNSRTQRPKCHIAFVGSSESCSKPRRARSELMNVSKLKKIPIRLFMSFSENLRTS